MSRNIIRDGQDRVGLIKAEPPLFDDDLKFGWRMCLPEETEELDGQISRLPARLYVMECAKVIASHVTWWSETDLSDKPLALSPNNIKQLPPKLFTRLLSIVQGRTASDEPDSEIAAALNKAAEDGTTLGVALLGATEKN